MMDNRSFSFTAAYQTRLPSHEQVPRDYRNGGAFEAEPMERQVIPITFSRVFLKK
jgi:hypothetical protein